MKKISFLISVALVISLLIISSCEKISTNDWKELKRCPGEPTIEYEGWVYNTVQIGDQCWMAENLNVGSMINGSIEASDNNIIEKYCYQNDPSNCNTYGGLYQWNELTQYAESGSYRGICPDGWAIPNENDWKALLEYQEGYSSYKARKLIDASEDYWQDANKYNTGTNETGFTALPSGEFNPSNIFLEKGKKALFWTTNREKAFSIEFSATTFTESTPSVAISVRCIKKNSPPVIKLITNDSIDNYPINGKIEWNAEDENNNQVYCNLYLKLGSRDFSAPVLENTTQSIFVADELLNGSKYFWRVMATDNIDTTWSEIRMFRTASAPCPDESQVYYMGKTYHTVKIGNQCWMRENLDAGTMVNFGEPFGDNGVIEKFCRNNDPKNCEIYGGLYTWNEMMQYSLEQGIQGICPDGWRLPAQSDFQTLISHIGLSWESGGALKEMGRTNWKAPNTGATNHSGFTLLPSTSGSDYNEQAKVWTTTRVGDWWWGEEIKAIALKVYFDDDEYSLNGSQYLQAQTGSVRCIKNN